MKKNCKNQDSIPCPMTAEELNAMLEHSYAQALEGKGRPIDEVFDELEKEIILKNK